MEFPCLKSGDTIMNFFMELKIEKIDPVVLIT